MNVTKWAGVIIFSGCIIIGSGGRAARAEFVLPDSGQTRCYDDTGAQIVCPNSGESFYGQDGNYDGPQPAYQNNGDGTITDLNTGLMWRQELSGNITWSQAVDYCDADETGGYTDWRLPTLSERRTIIDYGRSYPALNTDFFLFTGSTTSVEWTSDIKVNSTSYRWVVCNNFGRLTSPSYNKDYCSCPDSSTTRFTYSRCVRNIQ